MIDIPNRGRVVAVISALALAIGVLTLVLLEKPAQAQAQTETFNEWTPFVDVLEGCASEPVYIEGKTHSVGTVTQDAAGGFHIQGHSNNVGKGVGVTSGDEYLWSGSSNDPSYHDFVEPSPGTAIFELTLTGHLIRKGSTAPEDDFYFTWVEIFIINANGEVTSEFVKRSFECK